MTQADKPTRTPNPGQRGADHIQSDAALDPSVSPEEEGPEDKAKQETKKEALRNTRRGDPFVVSADLEDSDQREAAPGTRDQD